MNKTYIFHTKYGEVRLGGIITVLMKYLEPDASDKGQAVLLHVIVTKCGD